MLFVTKLDEDFLLTGRKNHALFALTRSEILRHHSPLQSASKGSKAGTSTLTSSYWPLFLRSVPSGTRQPLGRAKGYENTSLPLGSRLALIPTYHPASVTGFNPKRGEERTTELGL